MTDSLFITGIAAILAGLFWLAIPAGVVGVGLVMVAGAIVLERAR